MRPEDEIRDQAGLAAVAATVGTAYAGMTYEQGVDDALRWVLQETDDLPITEEE